MVLGFTDPAQDRLVDGRFLLPPDRRLAERAAELGWDAEALFGCDRRRKYRRDRRPGWPVEPIWSFYPKFALDFVWKYSRMVRSLIWLQAASRRIRKDRLRLQYVDQALTPVSEGETQSLELFTHSDDARHAVEHARKVAHLTAGDQRVAADAL